MAVFMTEDDIWYRAASFGLNEEEISLVAVMDQGLLLQIVDRDIVAAFRRLAKRRTRSQLKRLIVRNRRVYNHDLALRLRHERQVRWERGGMRCFMCKHIPPQPGEIMEEESNADITGT